MYIIAMDGKMKRKVQVPITTMFLPEVNAAFNHVNETILVRLLHRYNYESRDNVTMFSFLNTGELLHQFDIPDLSRFGNRLVSHPNGPVALVNREQSITLII